MKLLKKIFKKPKQTNKQKKAANRFLLGFYGVVGIIMLFAAIRLHYAGWHNADNGFNGVRLAYWLHGDCAETVKNIENNVTDDGIPILDVYVYGMDQLDRSAPLLIFSGLILGVVLAGLVGGR